MTTPGERNKSTAPHPLTGWLLSRRGAVRTGPLRMLTDRAAGGFLMTMWGSGSHYLVWLLSMAMCEGLGATRPRSLNDPVLIGRRRLPTGAPDAPKIMWRHDEMPVWGFRLLRRFVRFPRYVVLVRDLRESFVSYFEKIPPDERPGSFAQFLRGRGVYATDHALFRQIRFLNSWARVRRLDPGLVEVVHYRDLRRDPAGELARVWRWFGFPEVDAEVFDGAVARSTKDQMQKLATEEERSVVRTDKRHAFEWYDEADRAYFTSAVDRYLVDPYNYDYHDWTAPAPKAEPVAAAR